MVCHSSYVRFSSFPISGRPSSSVPSSVCPPTSTAQSPAAWPSSSVALCDRCRRERLAVAQNGGGRPRRMSFWSAAQDAVAGRPAGAAASVVFPRPEGLLLATTPTTFSCHQQTTRAPTAGGVSIVPFLYFC
jgi:hypothetical protein